jgi:hypothetical protein
VKARIPRGDKRRGRSLTPSDCDAACGSDVRVSPCFTSRGRPRRSSADKPVGTTRRSIQQEASTGSPGPTPGVMPAETLVRTRDGWAASRAGWCRCVPRESAERSGPLLGPSSGGAVAQFKLSSERRAVEGRDHGATSSRLLYPERRRLSLRGAILRAASMRRRMRARRFPTGSARGFRADHEGAVHNDRMQQGVLSEVSEQGSPPDTELCRTRERHEPHRGVQR